ncbi:AAA family ATPase [Photobacterium kishitanii]|uniref:AAA family ATPase n=1 Tax=Photobacterium kishitanii TaxID=318456 RepID=UPI0034E95CD7
MQQGGLNLLVGENNAGKSSVIDAIRLVLDTTSAEWVNLKSTDFLNGKNELQIQLKFGGLIPTRVRLIFRTFNK